jgi:hypothetical protein
LLHPGSGSRIRGVKKHRIPDPTVLKNRDEKPTFFLLFIVSGASFISKKIKRTRILKKISPKTYPLDPRSGIRKKIIPDPDPGSRG